MSTLLKLSYCFKTIKEGLVYNILHSRREGKVRGTMSLLIPYPTLTDTQNDGVVYKGDKESSRGSIRKSFYREGLSVRSTGSFLTKVRGGVGISFYPVLSPDRLGSQGSLGKSLRVC